MKKLLLLTLMLMIITLSVYAYNFETEGLELLSTFTIQDDTFYKYGTESGGIIFMYHHKGSEYYKMLSIYDNDGKLLYRDWEW